MTNPKCLVCRQHHDIFNALVQHTIWFLIDFYVLRLIRWLYNLCLLNEAAAVICVTPAAHPTFCSFKLFTSYMLDACKQEREELVSFLCRRCWVCWSFTSTAAGKKKQLPICVLPASTLQQNQPEQTGNTPSPILPCPPPYSPSILSGPHTSLHSGSCRVPAAGRHRT